MPNQSKTKSAVPTQKFIEVQDIKDGVVILKNGGIRAICIASSINFELKGTEEQEALVLRFQEFLNSLDFPLQILIHSRKLDIEPYLNNLKELAKTQENELLHAQIIEYMDFIQKFVEVTDIMNKSFFVVIPYEPIAAPKAGLLHKIRYIIKPKETTQKMSPEKFEAHKDQLMQRVNHIINGLSQIDLRVNPLNTLQLTRLFYEFYNPEKS